ncbi:NUMOD4 domain-containing protein [Candidatus Riflebacteria bacterium]
MVNKKEIWRSIKGYKGYYEVSNFGRVRSVERFITYRDGRKRTYPGVLLKIQLDAYGYLMVGLRKGGKSTPKKIHRLVLSTFGDGNPLNKPCVNHKDGNKANNHIDNLEWVTPLENTQHAAEMGLIPVGEDVWNAKLTANNVKQIRKLLCEGTNTDVEIAKMFGVTDNVIYQIRHQETWKHVDFEEEFRPKKVHLTCERKANAKLTNTQVKEIKKLLMTGKHGDGRKLAKKFGVDPVVISAIRTGKQWKEIDIEEGFVPKSSRSDLTEAKVVEIKHLLQSGKHSNKSIAEKYGVSRIIIDQIKRKKTWCHVDIPGGFNPVINATKGEKHALAKLTLDKVIQIKKLLAEKKHSDIKIGERVGCSRTAVYHIKRGHTWKHVTVDE